MTEYNKSRCIDLSPARWVWVPSERTLPNTFALFKKTLYIQKPVAHATAYILGSSRYLATLNGKRLAWGPAPADPRYEEVDVVDLTDYLIMGENALHIKVCFFGFGDGTWVVGNPGLLYHLHVVYTDGTQEHVVSDKDTLAAFDNSYPAGQHKRWYLRALQEEHDYRLEGTEIYSPAMELPGAAHLPSPLNGYNDYINDVFPVDDGTCCIRKREIPRPTESFMYGKLTDMGTVTWHRPPEDWFRFRVPGSFTLAEDLAATVSEEGVTFCVPENKGAYLTYRLPEQGVGFVTFEITASEGCIVEAMTQESRDENKTKWLDNHFYSWSRHTLKSGTTQVITFEYESFLWLQLHIRNAKGPVTVKNAGMLRRYAPLKTPNLFFEDPVLSDVFYASVNTLKNAIIESATDGMGRERQQYGGDCTHQIHAFSYLYGSDHSLVRRYFETYTDGITSDGYYMDCWPATDRTQRISQVQLGLSPWAPIVDHPVQIILAVYQNYLETGDLSIIHKTASDFLKFASYVLSRRDPSGVVPAEGLGTIYVWIDHDAYKKQRDKCAVFNLYFAGMLKSALAPILCLLGKDTDAAYLTEQAEKMIVAVNRQFYDPARQIYIDNLPYVEEDGYITVSDRTLATGILFDTAPAHNHLAQTLAESPAFVTRCYPANIIWRYKALAKAGYAHVVAEDIRTQFATLPSIAENKALQEYWHIVKGERFEMSHCPQAPLQTLYEVFLGLTPLTVGFGSFRISPCLQLLCGDTAARFSATTPAGDISVQYSNGDLQVFFGENQAGEITLNGITRPLVSGETYSLTGH